MVAHNPRKQQGVIPLGMVQQAKKQTHVNKMMGDTRKAALNEGAFDMKQMLDMALKDIGAEHEYIHVDAMKQLVNQFYTSYIS